MRYSKAKDNFERYFVLAALQRNAWRIQVTASDLGLSRQGLDKIIKKHEIKPSSRLPDPASFIAPSSGRVKMIRRVILFYPEETAWMKSMEPASFGQLVRAGLKLLRRLPESKVRELTGAFVPIPPRERSRLAPLIARTRH